MTNDQPAAQPAGDAEHRAAVVAGIRALADLIEQNTDLPVPASISAQHSAADGSDDHMVAQAREFAERRGQRILVHGETVQVHSEVASSTHPEPYFRVMLDFCARLAAKCMPECDAMSGSESPSGLERGFHHDNCPVVPLLEAVHQHNDGAR